MHAHVHTPHPPVHHTHTMGMHYCACTDLIFHFEELVSVSMKSFNMTTEL